MANVESQVSDTIRYFPGENGQMVRQEICNGYVWSQDREFVSIFFPIGDLKSKDVEYKLSPTSLCLGIKGSAPVINDELMGKVKPDDSLWQIEVIEGKRNAVAKLRKAEDGPWRFLFKRDLQMEEKMGLSGDIIPNNHELGYSWTQDREFVSIYLTIGQLKSKDVLYKLSPTSLCLGIKGSAPVINDLLLFKIVPDDSFWEIEVIDGKRTVAVKLRKAEDGEWNFLLKKDGQKDGEMGIDSNIAPKHEHKQVPEVRVDPRLDVRIQRIQRVKRAREHNAVLSGKTEARPASREELVSLLNSAEAVNQRKALAESANVLYERRAPSKGFKVRKEEITSSPDGNTINLLILQPEVAENAPCILYLHGGGMMQHSCFDGSYSGWCRFLAAKGLVVVAVDFRNSIVPSSVPDVASYPAGLNDCVSAAKWAHANAAALRASRILLAGDGGGGNLALAAAMKLRRDGLGGLLAGVYAMCPMVGGEYPNPRFPSSFRSDGVTTTTEDLRRSALAYGLEHLAARDPLAWPIFAGAEDLAGLPPTVISVNECDPLREEGAAFHAALRAAGGAARLRVVPGTCHAAEFLLTITTDYAAATAADMAAFAAAPDMAAFVADSEQSSTATTPV